MSLFYIIFIKHRGEERRKFHAQWLHILEKTILTVPCSMK